MAGHTVRAPGYESAGKFWIRKKKAGRDKNSTL